MSLLDDLAVEPPIDKPLQASEFQQAIYSAVQNQDENLLVEAVAGSGKTTTLKECSRLASGSSIFLAFNKAIAEDIRTKVNCDVKTFNALGHRLWAENRPQAQLDFKKMPRIIKGIMGDSSDEREFGYQLSRVVGLAKNNAFGINYHPAAEDFVDLIEAYQLDIPFDRLESFGTICREAFEQSRLDDKSFDFDDQLWRPIYENWTYPSYSNIFPDECQDLNPIQHEMLTKMALGGSRIVAVGDRHQAIYGFRGASHDSMDQLKSRFAMLELPLSISYRCAQSVVERAQKFCPSIQWREGAPLGAVIQHESDVDDFGRYMVLCRTNAPLFRQILAYVRARKPCQVMSNFLDSFQGFIRGFKSTFTSDLRTKLDRWFERELEAARAKGKKGKIAALYDKYETVSLLCKDYSKVEDMIQMVKRLGDSRSGPIFATIHKAKGLEAEHVYILRPDFLGGFGESTKEQQQQEDNLHYVAITRAKETLVYGATR